MDLRPGDVKLVVRCLPGNPTPAIVRLRQGFKFLLRTLGLRVVWAAEVSATKPRMEEPRP